MKQIGADASDDGGSVDDEIGLMGGEVGTNRGSVAKIEFCRTWRQDNGGSFAVESLAEKTAQKAASSGEQDSPVGPKFAQRTTSDRASPIASATSASTIISTSSRKVVRGSHPS